MDTYIVLRIHLFWVITMEAVLLLCFPVEHIQIQKMVSTVLMI